MAAGSSELRQWLQAHGLRPTGPRLAILGFLRARGEHLTPAEIFEGLRAAGRPISIATLYQNLQALSRGGLVKRIVGPDGALRYDVNLAPHHHLVCQRCGRLVDVELSGPIATKPVAPHAGDLAGWEVVSVHVQFYGLCPQCAGSRRSEEGPAANRGPLPGDGNGRRRPRLTG
ncbi:Fur family transcriptional regulator [Carboxydochorda subterranea]|uniref:Fur family transcriptional regulator n=1 Tax=Carboxydichorda subterranea TaxID=3109565 RepID=A0ABZ1BX99_9FIRM|nr:Fur family transcriptional regulator [Limnochorda sp. L945t]WRP17434.1 Fur family transcriptional regulator [Limnochorda sp. L945t]